MFTGAKAFGSEDLGDSTVEALDRSTMPLVYGCRPVGLRSPGAQKRSLNSLPLSVRTWVNWNGAAWRRRLRKAAALAADLPSSSSRQTQRDARSMATNR